MSVITYENRYTKIVVENKEDSNDLTIDQLMELMVKPIIYALTYSPELFDEWVIEYAEELTASKTKILHV